jgi:hypothetical protein
MPKGIFREVLISQWRIFRKQALNGKPFDTNGTSLLLPLPAFFRGDISIPVFVCEPIENRRLAPRGVTDLNHQRIFSESFN